MNIDNPDLFQAADMSSSAFVTIARRNLSLRQLADYTINDLDLIDSLGADDSPSNINICVSANTAAGFDTVNGF